MRDLKLSKPIAWQEKDGKRLPVKVSYKLIGKNSYGFAVAKADPSLPIVIDPILQSTYLGGNADDEVKALTIHPTTGDVYVAGYTYSADFPKTSGGAQESYGDGSYDVFVTRLSANLAATASSGSGTGSGSGSGSGPGLGSGTNSGSGTTSGGGGGGCSIVGSVSPMTGLWSIFTWLLVQIFVLAKRIRTK